MTAADMPEGLPTAEATNPTAADQHPPLVSVVIPALNEAENLPTLVQEVIDALDGRHSYEIIVINDGSTDTTGRVLQDMAASNPRLRAYDHRQRSGQSAGMMSGARMAQGQILATLDGDGQNDPADIPRLVDALLAAEPGVAMVAGRRAKRRDSWIKRQSSRFANGLRSRLLRDGIRDTGCGIRAIRREVYLRLPYFDHMHRFLPALIQREGRQVIALDVNHRPRHHGRSNYGTLDRAIAGIIDLMGVMWLQHRRNRAVDNQWLAAPDAPIREPAPADSRES